MEDRGEKRKKQEMEPVDTTTTLEEIPRQSTPITGWQQPSNRSEAPLQCHQCGSLFSGRNPDCRQFDPAQPDQAGRCGQGEVRHREDE